MTANTVTSSPSHIPQDRVFNFDYHADETLSPDIHAGLMRLRDQAPPLFWTPAHGGHWIATDSALIAHILKTPADFSNNQLQIPPREDAPRMIPESLDPPEHLLYRRLMMDFFEKKHVGHLQERIDFWTTHLLEELKPTGGTDIVEAFTSRLPVYVFMEFVGFPLDRFRDFRALVDGMFREPDPIKRQAFATQIMGELSVLIAKKQSEPGDDIISRLIAADFQGRKLDQGELMSISFLLFLAGLDTVTNAMTFGLRHLAMDADLRRRFRQRPEAAPALVDELLRRYTFPTLPRQVTHDLEIAGVSLRAGEMVLCLIALVGLDEELNPNALTIDLERQKSTSFAFGHGGHTCLGRHLAKMELQTVYTRWLEEIPDFEIDPDHDLPTNRGGAVMGMPQLWLRW